MDIWHAFVRLLEQIILTFNNFFAGMGLLNNAGGLAIILFTIIARLFILPLTLKSLQSNRKMQELQPQIKELQRKYGKDQQKLAEETMKLYKEYKVNPTGGCLPMLFQLPIFIAVYQAVIQLAQTPASEAAVRTMTNGITTVGLNATAITTSLSQNRLTGGFLWLHDLGIPDPFYILPVLSVVFQLIVQLMSTPRVQDPQQKAMMQSMLFLPIVFGYIGFTFPSGAVLYWVVGSILSMIQQYFISGWGSLANYLKFLPPDKGLLKPIQPASLPASSDPSDSSSRAGNAARPRDVSVVRSAAVTPDGTVVGGEEPQKLSFWDVLRPLTEQNDAVADDTIPEVDNSASGATPRPGAQFNNPRRRKNRR